MNEFIELTKFINRLKRINITLELGGNFPWIYIDKINGKKVVERFEANHGFTIGYYPIRNDEKFKFSNLKEIFKLIKKYK